MQSSVTIYRNDEPIQVDIEIIAGMKASRDEWGRPESPDDDDDIVILSAFDINGHEVELSANEETDVFETAECELEGCFEDERY